MICSEADGILEHSQYIYIYIFIVTVLKFTIIGCLTDIFPLKLMGYTYTILEIGSLIGFMGIGQVIGYPIISGFNKKTVVCVILNQLSLNTVHICS